MRSNVFLSAALVVGAAALAVRLRNVSTRGALLDGASLPPAGARVRLLRGELSADGEIAWQSQGQAGIRFCREIDVERWVRRIGHRAQQHIDEAVAALRAETDAPTPAGSSGQSSMADISAELDGICERLAHSPVMTIELAEELLKLDVLAQDLRHLCGREQA